MTQSQPQGARAHAQAMINRLTSLLDKLPKQAPAAAQEQSTEPAVNREVLALQREYDLLLSQCAPPQEVLVQLTGAFTETKSLVAVVELGVPDAIGESTLTVPEIAKKVGADARKLGESESLFFANGGRWWRGRGRDR